MHAVCLQAPAGSPPDVWYQLLLACAGSPACLPPLLFQELKIQQLLHSTSGGMQAYQAVLSPARALQHVVRLKAELAAAEAMVAGAREEVLSTFPR